MAAWCGIECLGGLRIVRGERTITHFATRKIAALLAYLAYHRGHAHPREGLIEMLWPWAPPIAGRHSMSRALSLLRPLLEPIGLPSDSVILADHHVVQLNPATTTTDVLAFESALADAETTHPQERARHLDAAIALYRGELLAGL